MRVKKNETSQFSFPINWSQVVTSLVIGSILGAIAIIRLSDAQAIVIAGQGSAIDELEANSVQRDEYNATIMRIDQQLETIGETNKSIDNKITELLRR
jgi:uncharacterized membrane-anchored protein YhcB (DUF1043 family)